MATSLSSPIPQQQQQSLILQKLDSCRSLQDLKQVQALVLKSRSLQTHQIFTKVLSFCAISPYGNISYARLILAHIDAPTTSMYNVVIRGASRSEKRPMSSSMCMYQELFQCGLLPNRFTFPPLIKALADCLAFSEGQLLHAHVAKLGFESDAYVRNNLIRLYAVCGEMGCARKLFDGFPDRDLVSWATLISGYSKLGLLKEAVSAFLEMMEGDLRPDAVIITTVLSACSRLGDLELGRRLHRYADACNVNFDVYVGNALVDMYSKCGDIESAHGVFKKMPETNVVSWNAMITGLARNGEFKQALSLFRRMQSAGMKPDSMTLVGVLNSCANLGALELGEWVRSYMDRTGIRPDGVIGNALVDMYAKCGRVDRARGVFDAMNQRGVYAYTAMVAGLAANGQATSALEIFSDMRRACVRPNEVTFVGVLSACSHAGLVDEGLRHLHQMASVYGITPRIEHYGCVIDMLGRAGLLDEACEFVDMMPIEPDAFIWASLLGACRFHGNVARGEEIAGKLLESGRDGDGAYVLMSNMYAAARRKGDATLVRKAMRNARVKKAPGCSLIEVDGAVHEFRTRDKSHPRSREILLLAEAIGSHIKIGYA